MTGKSIHKIGYKGTHILQRRCLKVAHPFPYLSPFEIDLVLTWWLKGSKEEGHYKVRALNQRGGVKQHEKRRDNEREGTTKEPRSYRIHPPSSTNEEFQIWTNGRMVCWLPPYSIIAMRHIGNYLKFFASFNHYYWNQWVSISSKQDWLILIFWYY